MAKTIDVTELILRDAHQSLMATRMALEDMVPACEDLDKAGYWSRRVLGRRHLRRLHPLPERGPVGAAAHLPQADAEHPAADAAARPEPARLPALRGHGGRSLRREGGRERHGRLPRVRRAQRHPQPARAPSRRCGAPASTPRAPSATRVSPLHTIDELRRDGRAAAWSWAATRSASRTWPPCSSRSRPTTSCAASRQACGEDVRVHVHVHATTGVTLVSLMKAIEAGADCVDTAISSLSLGPGHNPTESLVEMLEGTRLRHRGSTRRGCSRSRSTSPGSGPRYAEFLSNITGVETEIFDSQIPGGMISNMESQLKQQGAGDRIKEVLAEVPQRPQGRGLPAAGHALQPDRRHAGRVQRDDGPLQGPDRRVRRPDARLLRRDASAPRDPAGHRAGRQARQEGADHVPAGRPAQAGVGGAARRGAARSRAATAPTRTSSPTPCSRRWRRSSSRTRARGPEEPRQGPGRAAAAAAARGRAGATPRRTARARCTSPITYDVKLGGKTHKVTVTPA